MVDRHGTDELTPLRSGWRDEGPTPISVTRMPVVLYNLDICAAHGILSLKKRMQARFNRYV